ncbi:TetR family transcriptional regulator [Paenibacillus baekrokdamisoli]|uniref:TetR family transcriptional regulator n=1 Tax=Paenibacillus baekrokdamisoli TaxID=1712516 RepID=A0A3G9JAE1_9BACL|nr:TetR/AcrR family transcriptional regulator [Paenibacillus baekrokdamisoli]MBB3071637.1 AcrR family transcriptional regulator [Paenibacillus baekrokdamisoli]BBH21853.1 TetR family transcriptional regulator [Paenibacillus baekrokdamisoli]
MEQKKPVDRRTQIVEAAGQSFAMFGYKATTMELVSKIAAVGKGTIYTFFPTKEDLFGEIIRQLTLELRIVAERTIDHKRPFFENLADVLYELLIFREKHELIVKLSQEVRDIGTPMAKEGIAKMEQAIVQFIQQRVSTAVQKGELRQVDAELTAFVMIRLYLALAVEWSKEHESLTKEEVTSYFISLMKNGVGAKVEEC